MNNTLWKSIGAATCLVAMALPSHAETRAAWGASPLKGSAQLDDSALMEVSGRGSIDEGAVKALQGQGKLAEYLAAAGLSQTSQGDKAAESAEKQAIHMQVKLATSAAHTVVNSIQLANVVTSTAAPTNYVPPMGVPLFGLPITPQR